MKHRTRAAMCRRRALAAALRLLAAAALARLLPARAADAADAPAATVAIRDYRFSPATLTVAAGTTVTWSNHERRTSHSVYFPDEGFESERMFPGETWQRRFEAPGRYPYRCGPHAEMRGLVVVTP